MHVIYARQPIVDLGEKSLFLAGPTPRSTETSSWRTEALDLLRQAGFEGTVFVPEDENGVWDESLNFGSQIEWEDSALAASSCIVFWIPRNLDTLPGFTTNIEFGRWMDSGKIVLGAPYDAPKLKYLRYYADKLEIPTAITLEETITLALAQVR